MENDDNVVEFEWDVKKFRQIYDMHVQTSSDWFDLEKDPNAYFVLFLNCESHTFYGTKIGVLSKVIDKNRPIIARVEVWINNGDGEKIHEHVAEEFKFERSDQKCEFSANEDEEFIFLKTARNYKFEVTVGCKLTFLRYGTSMVFQESLTQKLHSLYGENPDSAVTISTNGKEFKVPSTILSLHSKVFRQMFTTDSEENLSKKIEINDIAAETIEAFIKWMYTGDVCDELIEKLYVAADKYLVSDLKLRCSELMIEDLDESNAARRLVLSYMHSDKKFQEGVMDFISEEGADFMSEVFQSTEWHSYLDIQRGSKKLGQSEAENKG